MLFFFFFTYYYCHALLSIQRVSNLIGGRFIDSQSFASIDVANPVSERIFISQSQFFCVFIFIVNNLEVKVGKKIL